MKLSIYQIDAFAEKAFEGNPAAVCPLSEWLPDEVMQSIAEENNLSETTFFVQTEHGFHIRWFTPLDLRGVAITAKSKKYDFVVRFFAPKYGINEDPVTGSAYTQLIPYWPNAIGVTKPLAKQVSSRGGEVLCEFIGNRVSIAGSAVIYLIGEIDL